MLVLLMLSFAVPRMVCAQDAEPTVSFYSIDEESDVTMSPGESQTAQAPLDVTCTADIDAGGYDYVCCWTFEKSSSESTAPFLTRYEESTSYTLTESGGYNITCTITFTKDGDTILYESDPFNVVISESQLSCPNGFSPNDDGINDVFKITYKSIIKLDAVIFNRWGKKLYTMNLDNASEGWDGKVNGEYVKDGAYFLQLHAVGSDGLKYDIKKVINVLKTYNETLSQ